MKQNELKFGELAGAVWGPKYPAARAAAEKAIKKYGLSEDDFWIRINKVTGSYDNLIASHRACMVINEKLPKELKFDPSHVQVLQADRDGYVFAYVDSERGLFTIGEATYLNCSRAFPANIARNRLYDKVVLEGTGLYKVGIYGELEAEDFEKSQNSDSHISASPAPAPQKSAHDHSAPNALTREQRLARLASGVEETGTNLQAMLAAYRVNSLEELDEVHLSDAETIIKARVLDRRAKLAAALEEVSSPLEGTAPQQPQGQTPQGISPIAASLLGKQEPSPQPQQVASTEPSEAPVVIPLGQTIYIVSETAPEGYQELSGQTFDQIGRDMLRGLYRRKNAAGRQYVDPSLLEKIEAYIA